MILLRNEVPNSEIGGEIYNLDVPPRPITADPNEFRSKLPTHLAALLFGADAYRAGVRQTTSNWGPEVKQYLAATGINVPAPWCAAFTYWCVLQAVEITKSPYPFDDVPLKAYVESYYQSAVRNGQLLRRSEVAPGDFFALYYDNLKRHGHIGFVYEMQDSHYLTIEGNTNDGGSRLGYKVACRRRPIGPNTKFIRWD